MRVEPLDHTADVGVELDASSLDELYAGAAVALTDILTDAGTVAAERSLDVRLAACDPELLMVEWLEELVYLYDTEAFLVGRAEVVAENRGEAGWELAGTLFGEPLDPERHPVKVAIKGVTYHGLEVRREGGRFRARVIFDI